jgi:methionyl-tRNA formyltransferase
MGTPEYATTILKALIEDVDIEVVSLITQMDKPVGRKQILTPPHTKAYILESGIDLDIYQPKSLKDSETFNYISDLNPDFIVVAAYGQILPLDILNIAPCINLHASILPEYRGASPIQSALLDLKFYSGVTAMKMDVGLDTGDILAISYLNIEGLNAIELFDKLSHVAAKLTIKTLKNYDDINPIKQSDALSTYSKKIKKSDGEVSFIDAKTLEAKYRAFIFWPGVFLKSGLKLKEIFLDSSSGNYKEGEILEIGDDYALIGCICGSLKITKVQAPSKKEVDILSYLRGKRLEVGDTLS